MTKSAYLSLASSRCFLWGCQVYSIIRSVQVLYTNWPLPTNCQPVFIYPGLDSCGSERGTFPINWLITASAHNWSGTIIQSRCLAWSESELNANQVLLPINIAHTARTLSVLHPGLRCLTFITMALGPSLSCAGLQGERKGGHNSVKEASSRTTTAIRYWHQLLEAVMRAAVHCTVDVANLIACGHPPGPRVRTWQHFLPGPRSSRSHIRSYF